MEQNQPQIFVSVNPSENRNKKLLVIGLILVLIIISAGIGFYLGDQYGLKQNPPPIPQPQTVKIPSQAAFNTIFVTPTPANTNGQTDTWKLYTNQEYSYSFKYPPFWQLVSSNPSKVLLTTSSTQQVSS